MVTGTIVDPMHTCDGGVFQDLAQRLASHGLNGLSTDEVYAAMNETINCELIVKFDSKFWCLD
jgi:hypothetical protein